MKPWELLGQTSTPDGSDMSLTARDGEFVIRVDGKTLMSSRLHGSEEELATMGCRLARHLQRPQVLVGGLGMGFTLRATLDLLPAGATVSVAEVVPQVVEWNRGPLGPLAGQPLDDTRVQVLKEDVGRTLCSSPGKFDAILLDVDNGPTAFTSTTNETLYGNEGVAAAYAALASSGVLAVWSAWDDRKFEHRLGFHGFTASSDRVRARAKKGGARHTIFCGLKEPGSR